MVISVKGLKTIFGIRKYIFLSMVHFFIHKIYFFILILYKNFTVLYFLSEAILSKSFKISEADDLHKAKDHLRRGEVYFNTIQTHNSNLRITFFLLFKRTKLEVV